MAIFSRIRQHQWSISGFEAVLPNLHNGAATGNHEKALFSLVSWF
jgi:hypothetical protein